MRRGVAHKYGEHEKIDPEKYKDFVGDLRVTGLRRPNEPRMPSFDLIENAIPISIMNEINRNERNAFASPRDPSPSFR